MTATRRLQRQRLATACSLVPRILAAHRSDLPRPVTRSVVARAELTSTGKAVLTLADDRAGPSAVIKAPLTAEAVRAQERETDAMATLGADPRLADWRELIPRPLAVGMVAGQPYRVDRAFSGHDMLEAVKDDRRRWRLLAAAVETIRVLHDSTTAPVVCDHELRRRWIDAPCEEVCKRTAWTRKLCASKLARLGEELHGALDGHQLPTSWIHGDYWPGNLLICTDNGTMEGIVDWEAAAPAELPMHDLLHLLIYTERLLSGQELGRIIRRRLRDGLPGAERRLLRCADTASGGPLSLRHLLLLYWLRSTAMHASQQGIPAGRRYRLWEARNVHSVLAAV
jgi:aminoglycoside phosphotransferase (APT) family kinase protein